MSSAPIVANQLDVVLRNVADGITAQRTDGSLAYANDAAARLLGLESGKELIGFAGTELTRRFQMIGEDGAPLPRPIFRTGVRSSLVGPRKGSSATGCSRTGTSAGRSCARRRS